MVVVVVKSASWLSTPKLQGDNSNPVVPKLVFLWGGEERGTKSLRCLPDRIPFATENFFCSLGSVSGSLFSYPPPLRDVVSPILGITALTHTPQDPSFMLITVLAVAKEKTGSFKNNYVKD